MKNKLHHGSSVTAVAIALLMGFLFAGCSPSKPHSTQAKSMGPVGVSESSNGKTSFGDGTWIVGKNIAPGTYVANDIGGGEDCYWARFANLRHGPNDMLANSLTTNHDVVTILPSDAVFKSESCGTWTRIKSTNPHPATSFGDGIYAVGVDIAPGEYHTQGGGSCYWARLSTFSDPKKIIVNGLPAGPATVLIEPSDKGFKSDGCGNWHLVASQSSLAARRSNLHKEPWYAITNDEECVESNDNVDTSLSPYSATIIQIAEQQQNGATSLNPKALVNFDSTYNQLTDTVDIFIKKDGLPVGVKIAEPENNGMEAVYTFVRGKHRCEKYIKQKQGSLNGLGSG